MEFPPTMVTVTAPKLLRRLVLVAMLAAAPVLPAHAEPESPAARTDAPDGTVLGSISYYGRKFAGRLTASGEVFDPNALTMAHPWLPFGTLVRVMTPHAPEGVVLRVNDRGPFTGSRIADVSPAAARLLGMLARGLSSARLEVLSSTAESRQEASRSNR